MKKDKDEFSENEKKEIRKFIKNELISESDDYV